MRKRILHTKTEPITQKPNKTHKNRTKHTKKKLTRWISSGFFLGVLFHFFDVICTKSNLKFLNKICNKIHFINIFNINFLNFSNKIKSYFHKTFNFFLELKLTNFVRLIGLAFLVKLLVGTLSFLGLRPAFLGIGSVNSRALGGSELTFRSEITFISSIF